MLRSEVEEWCTRLCRGGLKTSELPREVASELSDLGLLSVCWNWKTNDAYDVVAGYMPRTLADRLAV